MKLVTLEQVKSFASATVLLIVCFDYAPGDWSNPWTERRFIVTIYHCISSFVVLIAVVTSGCQPTVKIEAPKEPITINLNIKLDADVRLRVEEKAKQDVKTNPIF